MPAALRISTVVWGRRRVRNRVEYRMHRRHDAARSWAIAELVVLTRWRERRGHGRVFSGSRLRPSLWRALPVALGDEVRTWPSLSVPQLADRIEAARPHLKKRLLSAPTAEIMHALIAHCGVERLEQLIARHADPARWESPGVPDLFLFARDRKGRVLAAQFVEVKMPDEPLTPGQPGEIAFLQSLGLEARVLRLIERNGPPTAPDASDATVTPEREIVA